MCPLVYWKVPNVGCLVAQVPICQHKKTQSHWMVPETSTSSFTPKCCLARKTPEQKRALQRSTGLRHVMGVGHGVCSRREAEARKEDAKEICEPVYLTQYGSIRLWSRDK